MSNLREAAQQALEALDAYSWEQVDAARTALRAALAQAEPEPVAWMCPEDPEREGRMNRDDIIRMAREALLHVPYWNDDENPTKDPPRWTKTSPTAPLLERFAAIVSDRMIRNGYRKCAQGQRATQFCSQLEAAVAGAVAAEREACAQLCEAEAEKWEGDDGPISTEARLCALVIRARGADD